jgi:lipopolysaccharide/colanic/teichoic acid biosynthesis glycosyltransferase
MRIWQSYNPPLSDQQTEIALERHYVNNWSARLDFALLSKIILAARNADERTYAA